MTSKQMQARVAADMALAKKDFARRLRAARENAGLTQTQLANQIGRDWASVQRWEAAKTSPRPGMIQKLARVLDVSEEHLQGTLDSAETTLERLIREVTSTSRALRELQVAIDGITATLERLENRIQHIEGAVAPITRREDWDHSAQEAHDRIAAGLAERRADRAARPRSS